MFCRTNVWLFLIAACLMPAAVQADVTYGPFEADSVHFMDVKETEDVLDSPSTLGDVLEFGTNDFEAKVVGVGQADLKNTMLSGSIMAKTNFVINSISVYVSGTYRNVGAGNRVSSAGLLEVEDDMGGSVGSSSALFSNTGTATDTGIVAFDYVMTVSVADLEEIDFDVNMDTIALTPTLGVARISIDDVRVKVSTTAIPEPTGAVLCLVGLAGVGLLRRRR